MYPAPPKSAPDHESASMMSQEAPPEQGGAEAGWKVESVNIRPAENGGFIVSCSKTREAKASGGGNGVSPSRHYQSKDYAFSSLDETLKYVQSEFGGGQPQQPAEPAAPAAPAASEPEPDQGDEGEADETEGEE